MIRLLELLFPELHEERSSGEVWRVDPEDSSVVSYGARNTFGKVKYFDDEESARKFASGEIPSRQAIRPLPKQRPAAVQRKQTYRFKND
jgi:hypothetical protein